jgi:protein ImuB
MSKRRILSLWFPRLGAERLARTGGAPGDGTAGGPLAVVAERGNMQVVTSLNAAAQAAGLRVGQPLRDAHAMCAGLLTRTRNAPAEAAFLAALRRWAGRFSPWVAEEPPDALVIDLSGCAHLFGGEAALLAVIEGDCADMGLTVRTGLADTLGAAWALARFAGYGSVSGRSGDAIDQEARATRARAGKRRHRTRGGTAPAVVAAGGAARIAPPGQAHGALSPLPVAALRLEADTVAQLSRLGLRRIGDLLGQPRAGLARRFGTGLVLRLDQAMGSAPEPVSPARPPHGFAVRLTLPEPIGLRDDLLAGIDRMLPRLCALLEDRGRGVRSLRLEAHRCDQTAEAVTVGLARPSRDPQRIRPLLEMKLDGIDAGFGIDMLRLEAVQTEPIHARSAVGHLDAGRAVAERLAGSTALDDLIGRLGARVGMEAITRRHPASSHIPEKSALTLAAAWSAPAGDWPPVPGPRPLLLWPPEPVMAPDRPAVPAAFRWRRRDWHLAGATGPERIAPEWWLDDPAWRSGVRDYWVVVTGTGDRLWLYYAHGGTMSAGWFCHGSFA